MRRDDRDTLAHLRRAREVGKALALATDSLCAAGVTSARLDALVLLGEALWASKIEILAHPERPLVAVEALLYADLVARRASREPLAYVLGRREFYGREFRVTPTVLVPRPETELLVELALDHLRRRRWRRVWASDVGTGSGVLAVTLAAEWPGLRMLATDHTFAALEAAQVNAAKHDVAGCVSTVLCHLLTGVAGPFHLIVANLPYIPSAAIDELMPEVARYEPRLALDGGPDGLVLNRRLLMQAPGRLAQDAVLLLEIGSDQGAALREEAARRFPDADLAIVKDLSGCDRVLRVHRT